MTDNREVMLQNYTRREFRQALEAGQFQAAIIPTGSIEQHLEHLPFEHDIASSTWVARQTALRMYPKVIVAVPMAVGISEHHMKHKGSLTAKPGSWLAVLFDAVECFARHGIENILILNGHGGNVQPVNSIIRQWRLFFESTAPGVNLHFHPYWNLIPRALIDEHMVTKSAPGHAQEFENLAGHAHVPRENPAGRHAGPGGQDTPRGRCGKRQDFVRRSSQSGSGIPRGDDGRENPFGRGRAVLEAHRTTVQM